MHGSAAETSRRCANGPVSRSARVSIAARQGTRESARPLGAADRGPDVGGALTDRRGGRTGERSAVRWGRRREAEQQGAAQSSALDDIAPAMRCGAEVPGRRDALGEQ